VKDWSPADYLKFNHERMRPARDLLQQVFLQTPKKIYDLGCGPGNSTEILVNAFPHAQVIGIDNSPNMIATAKSAVPSAQFQLHDLDNWQPDATADLLFSNATFQWLPRHLDIIQNYLACMQQGAVLALQMPDNLNEPSHSLMRDVAQAGPWAEKLRRVSRAEILSPQDYYNALKPGCQTLDIWHTIYNHPLAGADAIITWLQSTGLKPYLDPLTPEDQAAFLRDYRQRITKAYPESSDGTCLLRFPRLFIVAVK
jgi:trans-aconitate 2-methyltransferase